MIIVTGGAGFIGSNIVQGLNARGCSDILVVDHLANGHKCLNLCDAHIDDYLDKTDFLRRIENDGNFGRVDAIFHQGACSSTTEWDGHHVMGTNYQYSKTLLDWATRHKVPFIYASSASVYGMGPLFREVVEAEQPLNLYAYSKYQFDCYVRTRFSRFGSQVVGLRYFNVYGPREQHKGSMASVAYHFYHQLRKENRVRLFEGCDGYEAGEQRRDFIHIDDVVAVNLWLLDSPQVSGIFNLGTGRAQSFNEVARAAIAWRQRGEIEYIPFPEHLRGHYQSFTEADMDRLRTAGLQHRFMTVEEGVPAYLQWLSDHNL